MIYSPKTMSYLIEKNGFNFKKKFGQNFIIDENVINGIVAKSGIDKDTLVIEVGPGAGSLTYKLALSAKNVIAFEIDETVKNILEENLHDIENVEVIYKDFLKIKIEDYINKYEYKKISVVANLPYNITTPIIMKLIEDGIPVDKIVIMVQKEVGDRFKAKPGTRDYSSLSVFLDYYFDIKKVMDISRNIFIPKPNVDSIVLEFIKKESKFELKNEDFFFKLVKDSFVQKRKTLRNNLLNYDLNKIQKVLEKYNLDLSVRAEHLKIEIFVDIANELYV
jgi:16S rRNA (adenine1518-N6/adenine1519-N6)-dimethyltransferase